MGRVIYKPKTKGLILLTTIVYFMVSITLFGLHFTKIETFDMQGFLIGSGVYWLWCLTLFMIIKSQRIILEKDGTFRYKTLGFDRCSFHASQLIEVIKEKMNGHPVYVFMYDGNQKRKPIPYLPFDSKWNEILSWLSSYNNQFILDERLPNYQHTYKKYDHIEKR